jgi:hypothetical protein
MLRPSDINSYIGKAVGMKNSLGLSLTKTNAQSCGEVLQNILALMLELQSYADDRLLFPWEFVKFINRILVLFDAFFPYKTDKS